MTKFLKIILILLIIVLVLAVIFLVVGYFGSGKDWKNFGAIFEKEIRIEKSFVSDNTFSYIELDISRDDVEFFKSEDNRVKVDYYDSNKLPYSINIKNETLEITYGENWWRNLFNMGKEKKTVKIYLPNDEYNKIDADIASGALKMDITLNFSDVDIDMASGNIFLNKINSNKMSIDMASGNTIIENCVIENLDYSAASGDISASECQINTFESDTVSGGININNCDIDIMECEATSGDIKLRNTEITDCDISMVSGNAVLDLKYKAEEYNYDLAVTSGDINVGGSFGTLKAKEFKGGTGEKKIKVRATSGNVNINFGE